MIEEKIVGILKEFTSGMIEELRSEDRLRETLGIKSLDIVTLMLRIEEEFDIEFDMSKLRPSNFQTVESVCKLVKEMIGE